MKCAKCAAIIFPLKILLVNKWNSIGCASCGTKLNRDVNAQFWFIVVLLGVGVVAIISSPLSIPWKAGLTIGSILVAEIIDGLTVKMVIVDDKGASDNET